MKRIPENEFPSWPFWPESAPHPGIPKHLIKARRKKEELEVDTWYRIFWEDYDRARQQGLAELEVRYRTLHRFWRSLELFKRRVERPLALLLKVLAEGQLKLPYKEGRALVARGQPGARELYELNLIGQFWGQEPQSAVELPALEIRRRMDFLEIELRAFPRARADSADGMPPFFKYSHRWPRWLPRPLRLTLPLRNVVGSKLDPEAALRRELAMLTQLPFTLRTLLESGPLEEQLRWQLGIVAVARWHLIIDLDPPRDRPELLLKKEDQDLRTRLLYKGWKEQRKALFEIFQQAYKAENPDGRKKLPNLAWDRILERVAERLMTLNIDPKDIGYKPEDFDPSTPGRVDRWRAWFDQRKRRARN